MSLVKRKALAIVAMRAQGFSRDEIANSLGIKPGSVDTYVYRAAKSGFLQTKHGHSLLDDPKDRLEYDIAQRAVRNLAEFMNSDDDEIRKEVTLEVVKGTLFKKFDQQAPNQMPGVQMLAVKIELPQMPSGMPKPDITVMGGAPAYVEGSTTDASLESSGG